jgi:hypothetical protein
VVNELEAATGKSVSSASVFIALRRPNSAARLNEGKTLRASEPVTFEQLLDAEIRGTIDASSDQPKR